jgi:penicillin-binding protein 1A
MFVKRPFLVTGLIAGILSGAIVGWLFATYSELPDIKALQDYRPPVVSSVFSDDNRLIGEYFDENRRPLTYESIPRNAIHAVLAIEDARFFEHKGVRVMSILRALIADLKARRYIQGGSTITQQLAKTLFLTPEKTFSRKIEEFMLALQLELNYTKKEILTIYFNQIYFGESSFGLEAASMTYFGKISALLTISEAALLAGTLNNPSIYSPFESPAKALARRGTVLERMFDVGFISEFEFREANAEGMNLVAKTSGEVAPYFLERVKRKLEMRLGDNRLRNEGFEIFTGLNVEMQYAASKALKKALSVVKRRNRKIFSGEDAPTIAGAFIAIEPSTGMVKAHIGGPSFLENRFDNTFQVKRPPGSAFLPIVYSAAIANGKTASSILIDSPIMITDKSGGATWKPSNYSKKFYGSVPLMKALSKSLNIAAIKLYAETGPRNVIQMARRLGVGSELSAHPSTAIGHSEVTLLEMVKAYSTLANKGLRVDPVYLKSVQSNTSPSLIMSQTDTEQVISPQSAFLVTQLLMDAVQNGNAKPVRVPGKQIAAMSGRTEGFTDAWFFAYTPEIAAGVWIGTAEGTSLGKDETGERVAAPVWNGFFKSLPERYGGSPFDIPDNIIDVEIEYKSGLLYSPLCGKKVTAYYVKGTEPTEFCRD